jgi:hypothetical protein
MESAARGLWVARAVSPSRPTILTRVTTNQGLTWWITHKTHEHAILFPSYAFPTYTAIRRNATAGWPPMTCGAKVTYSMVCDVTQHKLKFIFYFHKSFYSLSTSLLFSFVVHFFVSMNWKYKKCVGKVFPHQRHWLSLAFIHKRSLSDQITIWTYVEQRITNVITFIYFFLFFLHFHYFSVFLIQSLCTEDIQQNVYKREILVPFYEVLQKEQKIRNIWKQKVKKGRASQHNKEDKMWC